MHCTISYLQAANAKLFLLLCVFRMSQLIFPGFSRFSVTLLENQDFSGLVK